MDFGRRFHYKFMYQIGNINKFGANFQYNMLYKVANINRLWDKIWYNMLYQVASINRFWDNISIQYTVSSCQFKQKLGRDFNIFRFRNEKKTNTEAFEIIKISL